MTVAIWILSVLLIAEFVFAPVNLWTGRTIGNYTRFTGLPPWLATRVLAPAGETAPAWPGSPSSARWPARCSSCASSPELVI